MCHLNKKTFLVHFFLLFLLLKKNKSVYKACCFSMNLYFLPSVTAVRLTIDFKLTLGAKVCMHDSLQFIAGLSLCGSWIVSEHPNQFPFFCG